MSKRRAPSSSSSRSKSRRRRSSQKAPVRDVMDWESTRGAVDFRSYEHLSYARIKTTIIKHLWQQHWLRLVVNESSELSMYLLNDPDFSSGVFVVRDRLGADQDGDEIPRGVRLIDIERSPANHPLPSFPQRGRKQNSISIQGGGGRPGSAENKAELARLQAIVAANKAKAAAANSGAETMHFL